MAMAVPNTGQLYAHINDSADCSSSSCPPSATSDESVPEGYVILTFDKTKRAKLKTAILADVSDCRFDDDLADDEMENVTDTWPNGGPVGPPSVTNETYTAQPLTWQSYSWPSSGDNPDAEQSSTTNTPTLIRTSPIVNRTMRADGVYQENKPRVVRVLNTSPLKSIDTRTVPTRLSVQSGGWKPLNDANISSTARHMSLAVRVANQHHQGQDTPVTNPMRMSGGYRPPLRPSGLGERNGRLLGHCLSSPTSHDSDPSASGGRYPRKMLRCDACGKHYRNDYSLQHHICLKRKDVWKKGTVPTEVLDGQVVYFCPQCHKPFRWLGNLTRHYYVHTGQRFFKCDVCAKEFFSAYQVKRHMNSHTGRRFKCEVCQKPFTCKYACAWHTRQHLTSLE